MPFKFSHAGASTKGFADRNYLLPVSLGLGACALLGVWFKILPLAQAISLGILAVLILAFKVVTSILDAKVDATIAKENRAKLAAFGEKSIEEIVVRLGDNHLLIHDIRCQFGRIDHLMISKEFGIFLMEEKADAGRAAVVDSKVRINGKLPENDFISEALRSTYWLMEELQAVAGEKVPVTPLIVFSQALLERSQTIKGVTLTSKKLLVESIRGQGAPLAPGIWAAREKIAGLLERAREAQPA